MAYRRALALLYREGDGHAPRLNFRGEYLMADEVVKLARRYGVPVVERPALARALDAVQVDEEIPEELFHATAVVLAELQRRGLR